MTITDSPTPTPTSNPTVDSSQVVPILSARGLVKHYGHVVALDNCDFDLYSGEILAVIGDNGAGKSTLIKALCGALIPDKGTISMYGKPIHFRSPSDARKAGIETVYQNLAVAPSLTISENLFLGREKLRNGIVGRLLRLLNHSEMLRESESYMQSLKFRIQNMRQRVDTLSGGQRQGVAVARSAAFAKTVIIMDEPTAALGVKESRMVLDLIRQVRDRGLPVIFISHNMPHVFELADRIHIQRLGRREVVVNKDDITMADAVAIMTGAKTSESIA
ncbi:MAG: ATP-binding cassette domain-containing protein [Aggregatilineales bacterium]